MRTVFAVAFRRNAGILVFLLQIETLGQSIALRKVFKMSATGTVSDCAATSDKTSGKFLQGAGVSLACSKEDCFM
jgi:hypothetical protein